MEKEEQLLKKVIQLQQKRPDEKVTLSSIKNYKYNQVIPEDSRESRVKFRNYTQEDTKIRNDKLFTLYCAVCGQFVLSTDRSIYRYPVRGSDKSYCINLKYQKHKHYFVKDQVVYIQKDIKKMNPDNFVISNNEENKTDKLVEKQYRWKCPECGNFLGYQCISYDESEQIKAINVKDLSNKPYLYIVALGFVVNPNTSRLYQELERQKQ